MNSNSEIERKELWPGNRSLGLVRGFKVGRGTKEVSTAWLAWLLLVTLAVKMGFHATDGGKCT